MRKILGAFLLLMATNAGAAEGILNPAIEVGHGDSTDMMRVAFSLDWEKRWFDSGNWMVAGFWEASLGEWKGKSSAGNNQSIVDVGLTPVFRFQQRTLSGLAPYAEAAIGFHLISPTFINANRKFGSAFQFGDHVGFGIRLGERYQYDLGYRYQHFSNGSIKQLNQGINFNQIRFTYHF
jgi:hypothetical protein